MTLRDAALLGSILAGVLGTGSAAGQGSAPAPSETVARPVVIATDAYVRSAKYEKHAFRGVTYDSSGLPAATMVSLCLWPRAVRFVGQHDRTYVVFGDRGCHPAIVSYDHGSRQWSKPRKIGRTGVVDDSHGLPTLAISREGYLHVVFGSHGGKQYVTRSTVPEEIDQWEPPTVVAPGATYSDVYFVADTLHIFHRERAGAWGFRTSGDGGRSWSDFRAVCQAFTKPYSGVFYPGLSLGNERPTPRLHMFWLYYGTPGWKDMYYAVSPDLGNTWQRADGRPIGPRIEYGQGDRLYEGDTHGWQHQVVVDPSGRPGLMFGTGGPGIVDNNAILFAYWTGSQWKVSKVCDVASRYCQGTTLVKGPDHYRAYVPNGKWNGGEILEYETTDGGRTWKHTRDLTRNSPAPNNSPQTVENASPELQLVWCSGDREVEGKLLAWGEAGPLPAQPDPVIGAIRE